MHDDFKKIAPLDYDRLYLHNIIRLTQTALLNKRKTAGDSYVNPKNYFSLLRIVWHCNYLSFKMSSTSRKVTKFGKATRLIKIDKKFDRSNKGITTSTSMIIS
ncbi:unnamed protein product [Rhizophagus irregularis]|nr:unnamed protein product [Rhizophagus irregularis]CAB4413999.1 unnamed protein product [Rhizophagus irregularis]